MFQSQRRDSNPQHPAYKAGALPIVLRRHIFNTQSLWSDLNTQPADYETAALPIALHRHILCDVSQVQPQGVEPCVIGYKPISQNRRERAA